MAQIVFTNGNIAALAFLHLSTAFLSTVVILASSVKAQDQVEQAHKTEAALNSPHIVQDFMAALPPSDPMPRQYEFISPWTGRVEVADRPEQDAYYRLRQWVTAHRFLSRSERSRRMMKAILLRATEGFAAECAAKGGYLEAKDSNFHALTRSNIQPKTSFAQLEICMRSKSKSLGALLTENRESRYSYSIITFHPDMVVTQATLDARAAGEAAEQRRRDLELEQERIAVERWRPTIRAGTETGCGPVLSVNGDMVEVVHYQTRDPRWFRRSELWPTLYNKSGLRTCP